jgi:hypothetical protein
MNVGHNTRYKPSMLYEKNTLNPDALDKASTSSASLSSASSNNKSAKIYSQWKEIINKHTENTPYCAPLPYLPINQ